MRTRIIRLINNFYYDNWEIEETKREKPLGQYCVFGYFDALDVIEVPGDDTNIGIWKKLSSLSQEYLDDNHNRRNLICITEDDETDKRFWENKDNFRFLFITLIRVKDMPSEKLMKAICQMNSSCKDDTYDCCAYLSYDHCEAVIVRESNQYSVGLNKVKELRDEFGAFKMYTIFAVNERLLQNSDTIINTIVDEQIDIRLHCIVKDFNLARAYIQDLKNNLIKKSKNQLSDFKEYETLGSSDWIIEVNDISLSTILEYYKMGGLLTHTNSKYEKAFFNIESQILLKTGVNRGNGTMDR